MWFRRIHPSPQFDLRRGVSASVFFSSPLREAHIKNPNNKTVPEGVMQGLDPPLSILSQVTGVALL